MAAPTSYAGCCGGSYINTAGTATTVSTTTGMNNTGVGNGILYRNSAVTFNQITDGTSNTVLVEERCFANVMGTWAGAISGGYCNQGAFNPHAVAGHIGQGAGDLVLIHSGTINSPSGRNLDDCASMHPGGANILFADGTVHFLHNISSGTTDSTNFQAMGTIAGGEAVPGDMLN